MRLRHLSEKTAFLLLGFLVLGACGKDDPEPPVPGSGEGLLRVSVRHTGDTPLAVFAYKVDGSRVAGKEEPAGTPSTWSWSERLVVGEYALLVAGADPAEVRLGDTENLGKAYAAALPSGSDSLLVSLDSPLYVESVTGIKVTDGDETAISSTPKDIRRILRLTIDAGKGFGGAKVEGRLDGIASSVRLSDRIATGVGVLDLDFRASAAGVAGVYQAVAGILGTVTLDGSDRSNVCTLSFETAGGERFSYKENLTASLHEAMSSGRDTQDLSLKVSPAVPIRLYTGIQTRAAVDVFDSTPVSIAVGTSAGDYTEHWTGTATEGDILLDPERYYPTDGSALFIRSYHPAAPHVNGEVRYELTGQEDLMLTDERSGSLSRRFDATETPLIHKHLLTQLSFRLRVKGAPDGYSVHAVKLNGLASVAKVSLSDGEVVPVGETSSVIIYSSDDGNGIPVVDGVVTLPGFVLVQPKASLTLDMTLALEGDPASGQDFKDLPVSFGGEGNESGGAYDIEISLEIPVDPEEPDDPDTPEEPKEPDPFEEYQVKITATVTPWKPGNGGNADL